VWLVPARPVAAAVVHVPEVLPQPVAGSDVPAVLLRPAAAQDEMQRVAVRVQAVAPRRAALVAQDVLAVSPRLAAGPRAPAVSRRREVARRAAQVWAEVAPAQQPEVSQERRQVASVALYQAFQVQRSGQV
jgi:hypothetical protein